MVPSDKRLKRRDDKSSQKGCVRAVNRNVGRDVYNIVINVYLRNN